MKKFNKLFLISIAALICINCRDSKTKNGADSSIEGFSYGFVLRGSIGDHNTGAAIDLRDGLKNDTLYVFDFLNNQSQGTTKINLSADDISFFAKTITSSINQQVQNEKLSNEKVSDGTKVNLYKLNNNLKVNVDIQITSDIKTQLPELDSLIRHLQEKGANIR